MRLLSEGSGVSAAVPAGQDFAERMGGWLSVADAITLRSALQTRVEPRETAPTRTGATASNGLADELQKVRATLTQSIESVEPAQPQRSRADHSAQGALAAPVLPFDVAAEFALLHQRYVEQQRRMEMSVDALRCHARERLTATSPELAQLAMLDGVMDQMLGGREQHLLSTVPSFLKKRFEQLRRAAASEATPEAQPDPTRAPAWMDQLAAEFQQALLAELDLRLQPVAGMAEALAT